MQGRAPSSLNTTEPRFKENKSHWACLRGPMGWQQPKCACQRSDIDKYVAEHSNTVLYDMLKFQSGH